MPPPRTDSVKSIAFRIGRRIFIGTVGLTLLLSAVAMLRQRTASIAALATPGGCAAIVVDRSGWCLDLKLYSDGPAFDFVAKSYEVDPIIDTMEEGSHEDFRDEGVRVWRLAGFGFYWGRLRKWRFLTVRHLSLFVCGTLFLTVIFLRRSTDSSRVRAAHKNT